MHLDEERLQRLLHGELSESEERSARAHVSECTECGARLADAERTESEVASLLGRLDMPAPGRSFRDVRDRAASGRRARFTDRRWLRVAAGLFVVAGIVGAAFALPGSPVPRWVDRVAGWVGGQGTGVRTPDSSGSPATEGAGIAVRPGAQLVIRFKSPQGTARVSLTDGAEVVVRAPAGSATYTFGAERLVIENRGHAATFDIQVPRAAPRIEIAVGETRHFLKEGGRFTVRDPADSSGAFVIRLNPSRP